MPRRPLRDDEAALRGLRRRASLRTNRPGAVGRWPLRWPTRRHWLEWLGWQARRRDQWLRRPWRLEDIRAPRASRLGQRESAARLLREQLVQFQNQHDLAVAQHRRARHAAHITQVGTERLRDNLLLIDDGINQQ